MNFFRSSSDGLPPSRQLRKAAKAPAARSRHGRPPQLEALEDRFLPTCNVISGHVFYDVNNNGIFDNGEAPIANSPIELRNAQNIVVGSTVTDANGFYQFDDDATIDTSVHTLTKTASFPSTQTNYSLGGLVAQFDSSLGDLQSVEITNSGSITSNIAVENTSNSSASTISANVGGKLTLTGPGGVSIQTNISQNVGSFNATIYDKVLDFGGTSGKSFGNNTANGSQSIVLTGAAMNAFIGSGNVSVTETAEASSTATGGGNVLVGVTSTALAQVTVVYKYIPNNCLKPGNYTIYQLSDPPGFIDGKESRNFTVLNNPPGVSVIPLTLTNVDLPNNDFGELKASSLSGYVYADVSPNGYNDGAKQGNEAGIGSVTVTLTGTDASGLLQRTTTTDANGFYKFSDLRTGVYNLTETQPAGWIDGKDTIGTPGGTTLNDEFRSISLPQAFDGVNNNFGEIRVASLEGTVYFDASNNGVQDPGEPGIPGTTVQLNGVDVNMHPFTMATTTDAAGHYKFTNLPPGTYQIVEIQPAGYLDGKDALGSLGGSKANDVFSSIVLPAGGQGVKYDFGELIPSMLSGYVYQDTSPGGFNDGIKQPGELPIPGTVVTLTGTDDLGQVFQQTTTDATGFYVFAGLRPGTYALTETQPAGFIDGKDTIGTLGGQTGNDAFAGIVLPQSIHGANNNFGELKPVISNSHPPEFPKIFSYPPEFSTPAILPIISKSQLLTGNGSGVSDAQAGADAKFVNSIYTAVLGRSVESQALTGWLLYFRAGGNRNNFVALIWTSDEHRARQIDGLTRQILNQPADTATTAYYLQAFKSGWTESEVTADIFRIARAQQPNATAYLNLVFDKVLGTSPTPDDYDLYTSGNASAYDIARNVLDRVEARTAVVKQVYAKLLGRVASAAEVQAWINQFQAGLSYGSFVVAVLESSEFGNHQ